MQGKAPVLCSIPLAYALDKLTKNQLIDLVADMNRKSHGEDISDDVILSSIQKDMDPIWRTRGDTPVLLTAAYTKFEKAAEAYKAKYGIE